MSDSVEVPKLKDNQKLSILLIQRQILSLQLELDSLKNALDKVTFSIAKDLVIDTDKYILDLNSLTVVPKG